MSDFSPIVVQRVIHTIHATYDLHACRLLYQDALGGLVFAENYFPAEDRDCALLYVANHSIEPMAPRTRDDMSKGFARMTSKIGESFHSFELKVEDGPAASEAIRGAGGVVASDYGFFFFVKPETTGGVLLEVCSSTMPNDPYDRPGGWGPGVGTGHASSVLQLDHIACVTGEIDKAVDFFTSVINGRIIEDKTTSLPQRGRRVLLGIGDIQVAFIQPDDTQQGPLGAFLNKPQNGIYALVWRIADEQLARQHFEKRNLRMTEVACVSAGFAIDPADFFGGRHEFVTANS
ncbi:VOC family protein [Novosphingobium sp. ST904]|uniref:VOC family protein n=1 Tax=Novosphingobium sp. ST904 TaxID=1684385 RepID=UPI0006C88749|nr:VOC family protein [Novosphingobium sp. ST904]KPH61499.1 lactoylglutathione lyase [Novosphingobium sp. ST904]